MSWQVRAELTVRPPRTFEIDQRKGVEKSSLDNLFTLARGAHANRTEIGITCESEGNVEIKRTNSCNGTRGSCLDFWYVSRRI